MSTQIASAASQYIVSGSGIAHYTSIFWHTYRLYTLFCRNLCVDEVREIFGGLPSRN